MQINKIGSLYIIKGHAINRYFTASGMTAKEALAKLFQEIAIERTLKAWNK